MENTMFKVGQRLEVTDNTGKPINPVQFIKVLGINDVTERYGPEYQVYVENPDEEEVLKFGSELAHETFWCLDQAVRENRIFVKVLEEG